MIHLDYRDARPIYTQIADGVREQILSGILPRGAKLPSVRELAFQLTINPNTIQRAYRELEAQGWIATVGGKGCFVSGVPENADKTAALEEFDRVTRRLYALGVTPSELQRRLEKGDEQNA